MPIAVLGVSSLSCSVEAGAFDQVLVRFSVSCRRYVGVCWCIEMYALNYYLLCRGSVCRA